MEGAPLPALGRGAFGRSQFVEVFHDSPLVPRAAVPDVRGPGGGPTAAPASSGSSGCAEAADAAAGSLDASSALALQQQQQLQLAKPDVEPRVPTRDFEIDYTQLSVGELIGQGAFGKVFKGKWRGTEVAIKKLVCTALTPAVVDEFRREVAVLRCVLWLVPACLRASFSCCCCCLAVLPFL